MKGTCSAYINYILILKLLALPDYNVKQEFKLEI